MAHNASLIILVAFGTRGDVQPIACVAKELMCKHQHRVSLVTHEAHKHWLCAPPFDVLTIQTVSSRPEGDREAHDESARHVETLHAVQAVVDNSSKDSHADSRSPSLLICLNMFALEAYSIAEAMGAPCVAVAPYQIPYSCPSGFFRKLADQSPVLFDMLEQADEERNSEGVTRTLSMAEVKHWMWPLFNTRRWQHVRQTMGLAPSVLHDPHTHCQVARLPLATPLLYGFSELVYPRPGFWPASVHVCGFWLPRLEWHSSSVPPHATAALQDLQQREAALWQGSLKQDALNKGASSEVTLTANKCPHSALTSDSMPFPSANKRPCTLDQDNNRVVSHATATSSPDQAAPIDRSAEEGVNQASGGAVPEALLIDLASSGQLGLMRDPHYVMEVLARAVAQIGRCALLLITWPPLQAAHAALPEHLKSALVLITRPVPHTALLPHCSCILHPGGSGTTAAGLLTGVPQVMCPLHLDQFSHAERLGPEGLGLTPSPLPSHVLGGNEQACSKEEAVSLVASALRSALQPGTAVACRQFAEVLQEDGLGVAAALIVREMERAK